MSGRAPAELARMQTTAAKAATTPTYDFRALMSPLPFVCSALRGLLTRAGERVTSPSRLPPKRREARERRATRSAWLAASVALAVPNLVATGSARDAEL